VPSQVKTPAAPPVYRPQPTPKALQMKKAGVQKPLAAPPPYRPELKKIVQQKPTPIAQKSAPLLPSRAVPGMDRVKSSLSAALALPPNVSQARSAMTPTPSVVVQMRRRRRGKEGSVAAIKRAERKARAEQQEAEAAIKKQQRAANDAQATFLIETTQDLFPKAKARNRALMEVQAGIIGDKMYFASNYTRGEGTAMREAMDDSYSYAHGDRPHEYRVKDTGLLIREGVLHAEQQILFDLAKILRNSRVENPRHVTVLGSKRPCSVCRRVLLAFDRALHRHYPEVHLHFIDKTGQDTDPLVVLSLDLGAQKVPGEPIFNAFVDTYTYELAKYQRYAARTLEGEEGSSGERMTLKPTLKDLT